MRSSLRSPRRSALLSAFALLAVGAVGLTQAAPAAAVQPPSGAYWYTLYNLQKAWKITEGAGVTVAVIDSGVQTSLGDLRGQTVPGIDLTGADPGADRDDPKSTNYGHGTDMAAKIAGSGKGGGMVGIAPKAKILPVDVGTGGPNVETSLIPQAIHDAVDRGATVINLSIGADGSCYPPEGAAVKYAYQHGVIVVVSAGDSPGPVITPADCPGAIAVGGVDAAFKPWTQTPSGPAVDFVAPAFNLVNEQLDGTLSGPYPDNDGTSSAAAFTSGIFALLRAKFPHDSARQIVSRALYNVKNGLGGHFGERINDTLGYGMALPYDGLTNTPPASFSNPIYDRFDKELGAAKPGGSSTAASSGPSSTGSATSSAPSSTASSGDSGGGFPSWALIVIIVVVVIGVISLVIALTRRGRHASPPQGPPGGY